MLRSSKIEAIAERHSSMATIFEFICYHVHVAWWLRKWPKWAIGSTSAARPGAWHVRKIPDNMNIWWYQDLSGKKRYGTLCPENIGQASTWWLSRDHWALEPWAHGDHLFSHGLLCEPYCGCAAPKGHFMSPDSFAKGVFLAEIP